MTAGRPQSAPGASPRGILASTSRGSSSARGFSVTIALIVSLSALTLARQASTTSTADTCLVATSCRSSDADRSARLAVNSGFFPIAQERDAPRERRFAAFELPWEAAEDE